MSPLPSRLYTSGNTLLSKENGNWIVSYDSTSSTMAACFVCHYYGHLAIDCSKNIGQHVLNVKVNIMQQSVFQEAELTF